MKHEPVKIFLNLGDRMDVDHKRSFDSLDHEFVLWSEGQPAADVAIEFLRRKSLGPVFKAIFEAGKKCMEDHPDDDTYDNVRLKEVVKKELKKLK